MIILGIDTATAACSVAIAEENKIISEKSLLIPQIHSEKLVPLIDEVLSQAGLQTRDIDGISISIGPGSFTGLRIGLSVSKGLAFAIDKPIVSVATLQAMALEKLLDHQTANAENILSLIDARRDEVYCAMYKIQNNNLQELLPAAACTVQQIFEKSNKFDKIFITGDGTLKFKNFLEKVESEQSSAYITSSGEISITSASAVALIGIEKLKRGEIENISKLEPHYLKEFYTIIQQPKVK
ncbi:MAG: tRNA (adenosine(37)-N6)-threonylcarbamoyltransferase complex dimerization subunit type 1 TsaB [Ignavibacteriales bacterium]|nr:tRNA (adenosine(37)-N6)-threonylcarbamoyltransferase complex dimerization subunit type 1 TsaB [Ignavibacteriales bacterium]